MAGSDKIRLIPSFGAAQPDPMSSTAPSTGSGAAVPGYGVVLPSNVLARTIRVIPTPEIIAAAGDGRRRHAVTVSATRPPAANSQARVGSEKNAQGGDPCVQLSESANETTATNASAPRAGSTDRDAPVRSRLISHATPMTRAGHTR